MVQLGRSRPEGQQRVARHPEEPVTGPDVDPAVDHGHPWAVHRTAAGFDPAFCAIGCQATRRNPYYDTDVVMDMQPTR